MIAALYHVIVYYVYHMALEELEAEPPLTPPALGQVVKAIEQILALTSIV